AFVTVHPVGKPGEAFTYDCPCGKRFKELEGMTPRQREKADRQPRDDFQDHVNAHHVIPVRWERLDTRELECPNMTQLFEHGLVIYKVDGFETAPESRNLLLCSKCHFVLYPDEVLTHFRNKKFLQNHPEMEDPDNHTIPSGPFLAECQTLNIFAPKDDLILTRPILSIPDVPVVVGARCRYKYNDSSRCMRAFANDQVLSNHIRDDHQISASKDRKRFIEPCSVQTLRNGVKSTIVVIPRDGFHASPDGDSPGDAYDELFNEDEDLRETTYQRPDDEADIPPWLKDLQWINVVVGSNLSQVRGLIRTGRTTRFSAWLKSLIRDYLSSARSLIEGTAQSFPIVNGPTLAKLNSLSSEISRDNFRLVLRASSEDKYASRLRDLMLFLLRSIIRPVERFPVTMSPELKESILKLKKDIEKALRSTDPDSDAARFGWTAKARQTDVDEFDVSDVFDVEAQSDSDLEDAPQPEPEDNLSDYSSGSDSETDEEDELSDEEEDDDDEDNQDGITGPNSRAGIPNSSAETRNAKKVDREAARELRRRRKEAEWKERERLAFGTESHASEIPDGTDYASVLKEEPLLPHEQHILGGISQSSLLESVHCVILDLIGTWDSDIDHKGFSCPLQRFFIADSIEEDDETGACGFREPNAISSRLAFFDYVSRICILKETCLRYGRQGGSFDRLFDQLHPLIQIHRHVTMPFSYWQHTFTLIQRYARHLPLPPNIDWDEETQTLTVDGKRFTMPQFKELLHGIYCEAKALLESKVFVGEDMKAVIEELIRHLQTLEDNIRERRAGRTFLDQKHKLSRDPGHHDYVCPVIECQTVDEDLFTEHITLESGSVWPQVQAHHASDLPTAPQISMKTSQNEKVTIDNNDRRRMNSFDADTSSLHSLLPDHVPPMNDPPPALPPTNNPPLTLPVIVASISPDLVHTYIVGTSSPQSLAPSSSGDTLVETKPPELEDLSSNLEKLSIRPPLSEGSLIDQQYKSTIPDDTGGTSSNSRPRRERKPVTRFSGAAKR
ncbi:hypothetical protein SISSUDRAFT_1103412, partial [Sistotremastrum suecicum HHB10207 ss-3]